MHDEERTESDAIAEAKLAEAEKEEARQRKQRRGTPRNCLTGRRRTTADVKRHR